MGAGVLDPILLRIDLLLLLFLRMLGLFTTAPILSNRLVPIQMRVAVSFGAAVILLPLFIARPDSPLPAQNLLQIAPVAIRELMVGMVIGFVTSITFAGIQLAGQLLDLNMGLSLVNVLDPTTNTQVPLLGNLLYIISILIFFVIGGHLWLITAVMESYAIVPLGMAEVTPQLTEAILIMTARMFVVGVKIAAPIVAALFLTIVALGILNRAVPQLNVFFMGLPLQFAIGIFMLILVMPLFLSYLQVLFRDLFEGIPAILRLMRG